MDSALSAHLFHFDTSAHASAGTLITTLDVTHNHANGQFNVLIFGDSSEGNVDVGDASVALNINQTFQNGFQYEMKTFQVMLRICKFVVNKIFWKVLKIVNVPKRMPRLFAGSQFLVENGQSEIERSD